MPLSLARGRDVVLGKIKVGRNFPGQQCASAGMTQYLLHRIKKNSPIFNDIYESVT